MKKLAHPIRAGMRRSIDGKPALAAAGPALLASPAAAAFVAFSRPLGIPLWFSDSHITDSSRMADSLPGFGSKPNSSADPLQPNYIAPSPSSSDLDEAEMDDSSSDSKEAPLWTEVVNSVDANLPPPSVEPHPSQLESSDTAQVKSGTPELGVPPLSRQNELKMPIPLTFTDQQLIYAKR